MNVLHISVRSDHGGGPKHILDLLNGLDANVLQFIAAPCSGNFSEYFKQHSQGHLCIPFRKFNFLTLIYLFNFIKMNKINLIHSHGRGAGIYSRLAGLIARIPVVHTHHGLYLEKYSGLAKLFMLLLERLLNRFSSRIIFVSESEISACANAGAYDTRKSVLIPNCVRAPTTTPLTQKQGDFFKLIVVTRLEQEKGNRELLEIITELSRHTRQFRLDIVGDGPERSLLLQKIAANGLDDLVRMLGARDDVMQLLQSADAYITASHGEAQGIALLEAMSCGLPIIASRVRGHTDLVREGYNGILFDLYDKSSAAYKILQLLNNSYISSKLGENGRHLVLEKYSIDTMLDRIKKLYLEVNSTKNRPA